MNISIKKIKDFIGRVVNWKDYVLMAASIYLFVSSIEVIKVSAKAIRMGLVQKPPKRDYKAAE